MSMVHVKAFGIADTLDQDVQSWLNTLPQPVDVGSVLTRDGVLIVAREAVDPAVAAALLAQQVYAAAQMLLPADPSPDGASGVGPIQDNNGGRWTIGSGNATLRNKVQAAGGIASEYLFLAGELRALGLDAHWYAWRDATGTWEAV